MPYGGGSSSLGIGSTLSSGTPGSVLFVGAGPVLAEDNANLFFDDTQNRLAVAGINLWRGLGSNADNTIIGNSAGGSLLAAAGRNTSLGRFTLQNATSGGSNTAIGWNAMQSLTTGVDNVAVGRNALGFGNPTRNTALGYSALASAQSVNNVGVGYNALLAVSGGGNNVGVGYLAGSNITSGQENTIVGHNTGLGISTGSRNTIIGANVTGLAAALSNNIIIADGAGTIRIQVDAVGATTLGGTFQIGTNNGLRFINQVNGAGAAAGTLGNAPAAGNPTFWLPVIVNGTNRHIPCW